MRCLFAGLIFVFLDFSLKIGAAEVGLIPDFVGYILLLCGVRAMRYESRHFANLISPCCCMIVYTLCLYALDLFGLPGVGILPNLLALLSTALSLYVALWLLRGVMDMQQARSIDLNAGTLRSAWIALVVCNVLSYLFLLNPVLGTASMLAALVSAVVFLAAFYRAMERYLAR